MSQYNLIAATGESTVVAEYTPETRRSESYQSEAALEREFIRMLTAQGYSAAAAPSPSRRRSSPICAANWKS